MGGGGGVALCALEALGHVEAGRGRVRRADVKSRGTCNLLGECGFQGLLEGAATGKSAAQCADADSGVGVSCCLHCSWLHCSHGAGHMATDESRIRQIRAANDSEGDRAARNVGETDGVLAAAKETFGAINRIEDPKRWARAAVCDTRA